MTDNTERNRAYFDEHAATFDSKWRKTMDRIIAEIQARKDWIGVNWVEEDEDDGSSSGGIEKSDTREVRLLDYACGTGLVSRALGPYITSSLGVDLSSSMVNEFNKAAANQGIEASEMFAVVGDLVSAMPSSNPQFTDPKYFDFDIAVVGLGFHHFDNPALAAKRLTERLRKGGVLMIIDFLSSDETGDSHSHSLNHGHSHDHSESLSHSHGERPKGGNGDVISSKLVKGAMHTVAHHGFAIEDVRKMFEDAGVGERFDCAILGNVISFSTSQNEVEQGDGGRQDFKRTVFMARGVKV